VGSCGQVLGTGGAGRGHSPPREATQKTQRAGTAETGAARRCGARVRLTPAQGGLGARLGVGGEVEGPDAAAVPVVAAGPRLALRDQPAPAAAAAAAVSRRGSRCRRVLKAEVAPLPSIPRLPALVSSVFSSVRVRARFPRLPALAQWPDLRKAWCTLLPLSAASMCAPGSSSRWNQVILALTIV
jgi:hypothetical protein